LTSEKVVEFVIDQILKDTEKEKIVENIIKRCLASDAMDGVGCDNMTVVLCFLLNGETEEQWRTKIKTRHAKPAAASVTATTP
jgi:serine/threonine protein phosphatase PrpC